MKKRKNGLVKDAVVGTLSLGTIGALGLAGWVAFRLYVRQQVQVELEKEGLSETIGAAAGVAGLVGVNLNIPPSIALAKSIVPLWSTVMPTRALCDISVNGRESKYWPSDYRRPSALSSLGLEQKAFAELGMELKCGGEEG